MGVRPYNEKRKAANKKYDGKTYKRQTFSLRIEGDKEILADLERAKAAGLNPVEWLRNVFDVYKTTLK